MKRLYSCDSARLAISSKINCRVKRCLYCERSRNYSSEFPGVYESRWKVTSTTHRVRLARAGLAICEYSTVESVQTAPFKTAYFNTTLLPTRSKTSSCEASSGNTLVNGTSTESITNEPPARGLPPFGLYSRNRLCFLLILSISYGTAPCLLQ